MPALHVRDLDDAVIAALKARARRNHRSLQGEVRSILEKAVTGGHPDSNGKGRRLKLRTVSVGRPSSFTREVIYEDGDR
jgi:hypothetical protein